MANLINDELVNHTRAFVSDEGRLTWRFAKGSFTPLYRDIIKEELARVDDRLGGIQFKKVKGKPDLVIGHGDLPAGASAAAVWDENGWEIRMPERGFSTTAFRHEVGHVLGLGHVPMGTKSLMQPNVNGFHDFTGKDWRALESIWGDGSTLFFGFSKPRGKGKVSRGMLVLYP